ncbi:MAG: hypothetical protein H7296_04290 [Bacteroidia bacterium]|nr:hypothetical protein [Bacteroidia bacterium]
MEIRNALNQERISENKTSPAVFMKEMSESPKLKAILKLLDKRMEDRELLLRAYSFIEKDFSECEKPLSSFLDKTIETLSVKTNNELERISTGIIEAVYFQQELFGKHMFSRSINGSSIKLNSALFEVWISETYKLTRVQKEKLIINKGELTEKYKAMFREDDFYKSIVSSTSGKGSVMTRFNKIKSLINTYSK